MSSVAADAIFKAAPPKSQVTIFLEELCDVLPDFDYDAWLLPINGAQFTSGFHSINPNSKIPVPLAAVGDLFGCGNLQLADGQ